MSEMAILELALETNGATDDPRLQTQTVTRDLIQYIADTIVRAVNPQKIILFGSRAR